MKENIFNKKWLIDHYLYSLNPALDIPCCSIFLADQQELLEVLDG